VTGDEREPAGVDRGWESFFDSTGNLGAMRGLLTVYLKGICMGSADAVPGVSGGTIALITGIYERLISAVASFDPRIVLNLLRAYDPEERANAHRILSEMDLPFLFALGAGIATAVATVTRLVVLADNQAPVLLYSFFFGLIAASAIVLYEEVSVKTPTQIAAAIAGFALAFVVAGATESVAGSTPLPLVFLTGAIGISAMVLPGISGALLLMLLGQYKFLSNTLKSFEHAVVGLLDGGSIGSVIDPGATIVAFGLGAVVGLLTVAKAVSWALENYRAVTLTFLVSLMVGALRYPVEKTFAAPSFAWTPTVIGGAIVAVLVGGGAVLLLDYTTDDLNY
jgi:putative membrane protein